MGSSNNQHGDSSPLTYCLKVIGTLRIDHPQKCSYSGPVMLCRRHSFKNRNERLTTFLNFELNAATETCHASACSFGYCNDKQMVYDLYVKHLIRLAKSALQQLFWPTDLGGIQKKWKEECIVQLNYRYRACFPSYRMDNQMELKGMLEAIYI